jgi:hypothetical protein
MKTDHDSRRLEALVHLLLDGDLNKENSAELNAILLKSADARETYRHTIAVHSSLERHGKDSISLPNSQASSGAPAPRRSLRKTIILAIAASVALAASLFFSKQSPPHFATLSGSTSAVWENLELPDGGIFETGETVSLLSGYAEIAFRSGVNVIVEGPSHFEIKSADTIYVSHGRASVKVPKGMSGFHLDTPGGRITDLGTEFGVAVGSGSEGPVVMTEVFDGEIEVPEMKHTRRLSSGEALAMVRDTQGTRLLSQIGSYPVSLSGSARSLPVSASQTESARNLALGKPVFSPAYYSNLHGEEFGPWSLTDGRLNDSGTPGDWSFWLAPNEESGEFTVDLIEQTEIGRIDLQNTRNRVHGDRGIREFAVLVSDDNKTFREIVSGELARIVNAPSPGVDIPFETFTFPPAETRYVKVVCLSHYRHTSHPASNPNHGGGLSEIRIFSH